MFAAIGSRGQVLAAIFDPSDRLAKPHGQPGQRHFLGKQDALVSEAPAHVRRNHANLALVKTEAFREACADNVWHLRCGIDRQLFQPMVPVRHHPAPLHRRHRLPRSPDLASDADRRIAPRINVDLDIRLQEDIVRPRLVQAGRVRTPAGQHVRHRRKFIEIQSHEGRDILRLGTGAGHAHRHKFADLAHFVLRQHRLV
ncbi:hypothetical protein D9M68_461120 [compost metagenome]